MAIEIHQRLSVPPSVVINAIREKSSEWRESVLPEDVRAGGVSGVESRVSGNTFRLFYARRWTSRGGNLLRLSGSVSPAENDGCIVDARCGTRDSLGWTMGVLALLIIAIWWSGGTGAGILLAISIVLLAVRLGLDNGITRANHAEARYLVERLEDTLAAASRTKENLDGPSNTR